MARIITSFRTLTEYALATVSLRRAVARLSVAGRVKIKRDDIIARDSSFETYPRIVMSLARPSS